MDKKQFQSYLKETRNPLWHSSTIGIIGIFGIPLFGQITGIYPPLFDYLWAACWGFLFGGLWQHIHQEKNKEISHKLLKEISQNSK